MRYDVVAMDAYSNLDVEPRQISYLNDFRPAVRPPRTTTSPSSGDARRLFDRAHIFVSGTASIGRGRRGHSPRRRRASTRSRAGERPRRCSAPDRPRWPT